MLKILIAEDDLSIADFVQQILLEDGYDVCGIARTLAAAVALSRCHEPDLALIDLRFANGGLGPRYLPNWESGASLACSTPAAASGTSG